MEENQEFNFGPFIKLEVLLYPRRRQGGRCICSAIWKLERFVLRHISGAVWTPDI